MKLTLHGADIVFEFSPEDKERLLTKREIWQATRHTEGSGFNTKAYDSGASFLTGVAFKMALAKITMLKKLTGIKITGDFTSDLQYK